MYTILITDSNELTVTQKERIMCKSKLVDKIHFLADPDYKGLDMSEFTATLEYVLPISRTYRSEILVLSPERYKEKLEYVLPLDTTLTSEHGQIEMQITFTKVAMDETGETTQYVRKTSPVKVDIIPISAWSDIIPDSALTCVDQRILKVDAMLQALLDTDAGGAAAVRFVELDDSASGTPDKPEASA